MLGPTGLGALYAKKEILENMRPFLHGGDMIKTVTLEETTFNEVPYRFEAGTPSIADAIGLGAAIRYLEDIGMNKVRQHEIELTKYALKQLSSISSLVIYGPKKAEEKSGVISFNLADIHSHDLATIVNEEGIAIRSGHSCAMPLMKRLGCESVARASFYVYNTKEEIDKLVKALEKAKRIFKVK
jgi:cysteine desulfurase/selenocysteine lyase